MATNKERLTKEEALSFLLTQIVVEQNTKIDLDPLSLFNLFDLAQQAVDEISESEGIIPHEIIEKMAREFVANL